MNGTKDSSISGRRRFFGALFLLALLVVYGSSLWALALDALESELNSYVILIPLICLYLVYLKRARLPAADGSAPLLGAGFALVGLAALALAWAPGTPLGQLSENDHLSLMTFSFVCVVLAGGFLLLGRKWMAAVAFPAGFLFFMIPLPEGVAHTLENWSVLASAEATDLFLGLSGTPFLRSGVMFQLPNITLQVAQECSGIRSSLVLLITSVLASHMFLRSSWRRAVLVAFVIPLGILRNGFRILVIALLCVNYGPQMIHSVIHKKGGPLFFALSLIPLFLLLWGLRRSEARRDNGEPVAPPSKRALEERVLS